MKLNLRPNNDRESSKLLYHQQFGYNFVIYLSLLVYNSFIHHIILVTCSEGPLLMSQAAAASTTTNHQQAIKHSITSQSNTTLPGKDVTNLHLISDFRSVKLRWSYEHSDKNQPASFDVRFCELTSWNMEIKCRQRNMMVERGDPSTSSTTSGGAHNDRRTIRSQQNQQQPTGGDGDLFDTADHQANSVIMAPSIDTVHQLNGTPATTPNEPAQMYEAQIYDLRALTNYTFQVQVSRFEHEPPKSPLTTSIIIESLDGNNTNNKLPPISSRAHSARRLTGGGHNELATSGGNELQHLVKRIETKPFGAEATKCLADVSEVLINTGRYFGGRISVEDSTDPRCHLIGNKSSEQSTYLFKIDHNVCSSKIVDGKRIETMVLVHENKDILTHNTARFLVLCNFLQKSFTLRASVSLPKVNALLAPQPAASRPAVITSLPRYKPLAATGVGDADEPPAKKASTTSNVMLGSMPGIYRARVPHANTVETSTNNDQTLKRAATRLDPSSSSSSSFDKSQEAADMEEEEEEEEANRRVATSHKQAVVNNGQPPDELESNTIERKFVVKAPGQRLLAAEGQAAAAAAAMQSFGQPAVAIQLRQAKELGSFAATPASHSAALQASARRDLNGIDGLRARSMVQLKLLEPNQVNSSLQAGSRSNKFLAKPVQVQSKVLYIEREDATRVGRLHQHYLNPQQHTTTNSAEHSSQIDTPEPRMPTTSALAPMVVSPPPQPSSTTATDKTATDIAATDSRHSKQLAEAKLTSGSRSKVDELTDLQTPIIITNNHRISGDHLPVARQASSSSTFRVSKWLNSPDSNGDGGNNFTIKYSADRVDDFPVGNQDDNFAAFADGSGHKIMGPSPQSANLMTRARSGRMRSMAGGGGDLGQGFKPTPLAATTTTTTTTTMAPLSVADLKQPAWSVQRMGETFGSDGGSSGDLMDSETSNETTSQMMVATTASNSSLAQNITGAILRWSLKTLTNLARKSLESLINDTTTSTVPSSPFSAEPQNELANQASSSSLMERPQSFEQAPDSLATGANRWQSNRPEPASRRPSNQTPPMRPAGVQQHHHTVQPSTLHATTATSRRSGSPVQQVVSTSNTNPEYGSRPFEEKLMANDGFIISERQRDSAATTTRQQPLAGTTTTSVPTHNSSRPSNYSKSLDLSRISGDFIRHRNSSDNRNNTPTRQTNLGSLRHHHHHHHLTDNEINNNHSNNESLWSQRASALYTSWVFYGILLFVGLITAIVMIVCLVSTSPRRRSHSRSALDSGAHEDGTRSIRPLGFRRESALPGLAFGGLDGGDLGSCQSSRDDSSIHDVTYQKYDYNKFENYSSDSINNRLAGGGLPVQDRHTALDTTTASCGNRFSQQSPSEVSHSTSTTTTTRSMSANSSSAMIPDENDCKNNEFLYTAEHVLINTGASFGESYA